MSIPTGGNLAKVIAPRLHRLNNKPIHEKGSYVLYWVQASPRISENPALELAVERANEAGVPLTAAFALSAHYDPNATLRHYTFMLEGLSDFAKSLKEERGVKLSVALVGKSGIAETISQLAQDAVEVVVCMGYLRLQRQWYEDVAKSLSCRLTGVEGNVVVPVGLVSSEDEYAAYTIRPKIWKHVEGMLKPLGSVKLQKQSIGAELLRSPDFVEFQSEVDIRRLLQNLGVDDTVPVTPDFRGGYSEAKKHLETFVSTNLCKYEADRNVPGKEVTSNLSPYLHFGHVSPVEAVLAAYKADGVEKVDLDKFIEELMVRRELAINFLLL